jgi:hypothetical protein
MQPAAYTNVPFTLQTSTTASLALPLDTAAIQGPYMYPLSVSFDGAQVFRISYENKAQTVNGDNVLSSPPGILYFNNFVFFAATAPTGTQLDLWNWTEVHNLQLMFRRLGAGPAAISSSVFFNIAPDIDYPSPVGHLTKLTGNVTFFVSTSASSVQTLGINAGNPAVLALFSDLTELYFSRETAADTAIYGSTFKPAVGLYMPALSQQSLDHVCSQLIALGPCTGGTFTWAVGASGAAMLAADRASLTANGWVVTSP